MTEPSYPKTNACTPENRAKIPMNRGISEKGGTLGHMRIGRGGVNLDVVAFLSDLFNKTDNSLKKNQKSYEPQKNTTSTLPPPYAHVPQCTLSTKNLPDQVPAALPARAPQALTHRSVALAALNRLEPDPATRTKVWQAAQVEERNWNFLVREHGYPAGWFLFAHVDNHLRLKHGKGIALEGFADEIASWWLCDVPDTGAV